MLHHQVKSSHINKISKVLPFFRIVQSLKFGHYIVFHHVFVVDTVHNVVCVGQILAVVLNVLEVAGLALDHIIDIIIAVFFI